MFESAFAKSEENVKAAQDEQAYNVNSAENLEIKTNEEYNGSVNYSLWSYPKLNKLEWTLLNDRLAIELHNSTNFIDEHTKWLYATKNSTRVFAIYGIGWGNDATPLYAVGGKTAEKTYIKMINFMEEKMNRLTEAEKILKAGLAVTPLTKGQQAIVFLMMETEEQTLEVARFIANNKQATEKELMTEAQRISKK